MPLTTPARLSLAAAPGARRVAAGPLGVVALTFGGALSYMALEGMRFLDALYMTVITLSTVGYREVKPLSDAGVWYTMALLALGVGMVFYTVVQGAAFLMEGRLLDLWGRRSTMRAIGDMQDHVVVCGFGRLGRAVARQLRASRTPFVAIDPDPEAQSECEARGWLCLAGSARRRDAGRGGRRPRARWWPRSAATPTTSSSRSPRASTTPRSRSTRARRPRRACAGCARRVRAR
jgi:voltage-gated potassium channel